MRSAGGFAVYLLHLVLGGYISLGAPVDQSFFIPNELKYRHVLQAVYGLDPTHFVWGPGNRETLENLIRASEDEGLNPNDYRADKTDPSLRNESLRDLAQSDRFLALVHDLRFGQADHLRYSIVKENQTEFLTQQLAALYAGEPLSKSLLEELTPQNHQYLNLKIEFSSWHSLLPDQNKFGFRMSGAAILRPGDYNAQVMILRELLDSYGFKSVTPLDPQGFDENLRLALQLFQQRFGLRPTGIADLRSIRELNRSPTERLKSLATSMDLWRALPRDLGTKFLLINLSEAWARLYRDDLLIFQSAVLIGTKKSPTSTMVSQIESIDLHPSWHIPSKIARNEILPKVQADPYYLSNRGIRIQERSTGKTISIANIDWSKVSSKNLPYRFIQEPGPLNPLGEIRFNLVNPFAIHIHDTSEPALFTQENRLRTHGCLRVERARELAKLLIPSLNDNLERVLSEPPTRRYRFPLGQSLSVYVVDLPVWTEGSSVRFIESAADKGTGQP